MLLFAALPCALLFPVRAEDVLVRASGFPEDVFRRTKIHFVSDGSGRPIRARITGGQVNDVTQAKELLRGLEGRFFLADRACDQDELVEDIRLRGGEAVIPPRSHRREARFYDKEVYKERNRIERMIGRLKNFRRLATRFEKTARNFLSMVLLACSTLWLIGDTP